MITKESYVSANFIDNDRKKATKAKAKVARKPRTRKSAKKAA